jgi:hypothetical protein
VAVDKEREEFKKKAEELARPPFKVKDNLINDWTGQRFVDELRCKSQGVCDSQA